MKQKSRYSKLKNERSHYLSEYGNANGGDKFIYIQKYYDKNLPI